MAGTSPLLARAQALVPKLAARAADTEARRSLLPEIFADLKAAGLHRMCQPERLGGAETPLDEAAEVVATLARGCGSTAWVTAVYTDHSILLGKFDPRAADDVWGRTPDAVISAGYLPSGTVERVDGGWRLAGTWGFASGCDYADWILLGSLLPVAPDHPVPHLCLVPRREVEIDDNWRVMGLAGTGSKNIVVKGAVVPDHRVFALPAANEGVSGPRLAEIPPLYRLPHVSTVPFMFEATALGSVESLYDMMADQIAKRSGTAGVKLAEVQSMQLHFAEAAAEIDCARLLLTRDLREAMAAMREGRTLTIKEKARNRRDQAYVSRLCRSAADELFAVAGSRGMFDDSVAQRKFRDVCAVSTHISAAWDIAGATFGRVAFGLDPASIFI
jgi:3-hydroxy-9,10-secoandrosta-1,3,5(10)-triene-9,17-dione monooxygenase